MKRSTDRILVTHVGSLVRPLAVRDVMWALLNSTEFEVNH